MRRAATAIMVAAATLAQAQVPAPDSGAATTPAARSATTHAPTPVAADGVRWRLDLDASGSRLGGGRSSWREASVGLAWSPTAQTTLAARVERLRRGDPADTYAELRADHRFARDRAAYLVIGAADEPSFRPRAALATGGSFGVLADTGNGLATVGTLDARYAKYAAGPVRTLAPGLEQYLAQGRGWVTLKGIFTRDERGRNRRGFLLRGDWQASDDLRFFAGYADAPESSEGATVETRTVFAGLNWALTPFWSVRLAAEHERRPGLFTRRGLGAGLSHRF